MDGVNGEVFTRHLLGVMASDGWMNATLEPCVLLQLRETESVFWYAFYPDQADALADELRAAAGRARSKTVDISIPDSLDGLSL